MVAPGGQLKGVYTFTRPVLSVELLWPCASLLYYNQYTVINISDTSPNRSLADKSHTNTMLPYYMCIGVASYGALGHVPPQLSTIDFFQLNSELHKVRQ